MRSQVSALKRSAADDVGFYAAWQVKIQLDEWLWALWRVDATKRDHASPSVDGETCICLNAAVRRPIRGPQPARRQGAATKFPPFAEAFLAEPDAVAALPSTLSANRSVSIFAE